MGGLPFVAPLTFFPRHIIFSSTLLIKCGNGTGVGSESREGTGTFAFLKHQKLRLENYIGPVTFVVGERKHHPHILFSLHNMRGWECGPRYAVKVGNT